MDDPSSPPCKPIFPQMTGEAVSEALGFSPRWLKKLIEQGYAERLENKLFDAGAVSLGYIRWLRDSGRQSSKTEDQKRLLSAQTKKLEIANADALANLIEVEDARRTGAEILDVVRAQTTAAFDCFEDPILRSEIIARIEQACAHCEARQVECFRNIKAGVPALDPHDDDDQNDGRSRLNR